LAPGSSGHRRPDAGDTLHRGDQRRHRRRADAARVAGPDSHARAHRSVCADGAYDTRSCMDATAQRQAMALIPPRKNASYWKKLSPGSAYRNESIHECKRLSERVMAWTF